MASSNGIDRQLNIAIVAIKITESGLTCILNSLVILSILNAKNLRHNPTFVLICTLFAMDALPTVVILCFDVPSTIIGSELLGSPYNGILIAVLCICWFTTLFLLPIVAAVHLCAVVVPLTFRFFQCKHAYYILMVVFTASSALTAPLYLSCCGYKYYTMGNYWSFDYGKPYTQLYMTFNSVLQAVCIGLMIIIDITICITLYHNRYLKPRNSVNVMTFIGRDRPHDGQGTAINHNRRISTVSQTMLQQPATLTKQLQHGEISLATRLAFNFMILTACFVIASLVFNVVPGLNSPVIGPIVLALAAVLQHGKCLSYVIFGKALRVAMRNLFGKS